MDKGAVFLGAAVFDQFDPWRKLGQLAHIRVLLIVADMPFPDLVAEISLGCRNPGIVRNFGEVIIERHFLGIKQRRAE